jgi:hypothetical protein
MAIYSGLSLKMVIFHSYVSLPEATPSGFWFPPVAAEAQSPCPAFGLPRPPPDKSLDQGWSPRIPGISGIPKKNLENLVENLEKMW